MQIASDHNGHRVGTLKGAREGLRGDRGGGELEARLSPAVSPLTL